jgi:hypothetical protein
MCEKANFCTLQKRVEAFCNSLNGADRSDAARALGRRECRNPQSMKRSRRPIRKQTAIQRGDEDGALDPLQNFCRISR